MVGEMQVTAIVPARGGSKSIPRKNLRSFAGHPLLAYSIAAGLQARSVDRVIVSTDDEELAQVARQYGAEVPFLRPVELAADETTDLPVFQHALELARRSTTAMRRISSYICVRPPRFRPPGLVDRAVALLAEHPEADSVRGVVPSGQNPHKMWRISRTSGWCRCCACEGSLNPTMPRARCCRPHIGRPAISMWPGVRRSSRRAR